ncbi:MAG: putative 2OG-Fe(II) oxygenase [Caulobacterales bacterium]
MSTLEQARTLIQARRPADAESALRALVALEGDQVEAWRLMVVALSLQGRTDETIAALRRVMALAPGDEGAAADLAGLLTNAGRADEAVEALAPLIAEPACGLVARTAYAVALKAQGRVDEAIGVYERAAAAFPQSGVAAHNLAATLGDEHRFAESEAAASQAFERGLDAAETWIVRARALQGLGDLDGAERAFEEVIRRRPAHPDALGELSQLLWMRTEDLAAASAPLDQAMRDFPQVVPLRLKKARLLEYAGDGAGAYQALLSGGRNLDADPVIQARAAELSCAIAPRTALIHAKQAYALSPDDPFVIGAMAQAQLAVGLPDEAARSAARMRERAPLNQFAIALETTAWRLLGDPRYRAICDYEAMVGVSEIDTPPGWPGLTAYLADLEIALAGLHPFRTHPLGQSVRHGSQTQQSLARATDPAIQAFFEAIDGPIRRYIGGLGDGEDPLRRRRAAGYALSGIWSVRLRPGGFHTDHLHPEGWISSACYIALPKAVERGHEGWLKFGQPGLATSPALTAERFVQPAPGRLVLFPSYMWHGTVPFGGEEPRLSIAFDVVPA